MPNLNRKGSAIGWLRSETPAMHADPAKPALAGVIDREGNCLNLHGVRAARVEGVGRLQRSQPERGFPSIRYCLFPRNSSSVNSNPLTVDFVNSQYYRCAKGSDMALITVSFWKRRPPTRSVGWRRATRDRVLDRVFVRRLYPLMTVESVPQP